MKTFLIPGTRDLLTYEITPQGELSCLHVAGISYVQRRDGAYVFAGNWFQFEEQQIGRNLLRKVTSTQGQWVETYGWDAGGLVNTIDGSLIERDENGSVRACHTLDHSWIYHYEHEQLVAIDSPHGRRAMAFDGGQRPLTMEGDGQLETFQYGTNGLRRDSPQSQIGWNCDDLGRLWTVTDHLGNITCTYLWWGFACLARIDGPPGDPIAEIFSLDPTGTPVRATTPQGTRRFPRDAFGENLVGQEGVPGLFGGAQDGRFVHYRSRVLDPLVGAFTAPDPLDGSPQDPRRQQGFRGPLPVEKPPAGPYCVCQHDPCSRMDPTGEMSTVGTVFSTLSSLTWGFQNNLTGITMLGAWNILLTLFSGSADVIGRLGDVETMSSPWSGAWGVRAHPAGLELLGVNRHRAWTVQHIIWARGEEFEELDKARVFVPKTTFIPKLDGSLLYLQPDHGKTNTDPGRPFVIAGHQNPKVPGYQSNSFAPFWTRSGGEGQPVFEGSTTPWFPDGGIHFPYQKRVPSPVQGSIAEIYPTGDIFKGEVKTRLTINTDELDSPPIKGSLLLTQKKDAIDFYTVHTHFKEDDYTVIVLDEPPTVFKNEVLELYNAELDPQTEALHQGSSLKHLDTSNRPAGIHYQKGQYLKLEGGTPNKKIAGAEIIKIEAEVTLDAIPPSPTGKAPFKLFQAKQLVHQGFVQVTSKTEIKFKKNDPKPEADQIIVLVDGSDKGIYQMSAGSDDLTFIPDRDISSSLVTAGKVRWFNADREAYLGEWDGVDTAIDIKYTPEASGHVPDKSEIIFKNDDDDLLGVRNITQRVTDQIEIGRALPGGAHPHDATVFIVGDCLDGEAEIRERSVLTLNESAARIATLKASDVLKLLPLADTHITNATSNAVSRGARVLRNQGWSGNDLRIMSFSSVNLPFGLEKTFAPMPGQMVVLKKTSSTDIELATVKSLIGTLTLTHTPRGISSMTAGPDTFKLVPLVEEGLCFKASPISTSKILLHAEAYHMTGSLGFDKSSGSTVTDPVWFPRFRKGELLRGIWEVAGTRVTGQYRILDAHGGFLSLEGDPNIPISGVADLAFCKLVPSATNTSEFERSPCFQGTRVSNTEVSLQPQAYSMDFNLEFDKSSGSTVTKPAFLPEFHYGDLVMAIWEVGIITVNHRYHVVNVSSSGTQLELDGGPPLPTGTGPLAICKLDPPQTSNGTFTVGRNGNVVNPRTFTFSVLHPNDLKAGTYALIYEEELKVPDPKNPTVSKPTKVTNVWAVEASNPLTDLKIGFYGTPAFVSSNVDVIIPRLYDRASYSTLHKVVENEWFLTDSHLLAKPKRILIQAYQNPTSSNLTMGTFSPGTTLVPDDDSDSFELDRRQSLETHELQHTIQFLAQGPLVFAVIPLFVLDLIGLASEEGLESPEYSPFVAGNLTTQGSTRYLQIPEPSDIDFSSGRMVQLVQNANNQRAVLGDLEASGFRTSGFGNISDGQVAVRLERKAATKQLADAHAILEFLTTGGLQQALMGPIFSAIPWAISQGIQLASTGSASLDFIPDKVYPGSVPDTANPFVIQVPPLEGDPHGFEIHDCLELNGGNNITNCYLVVAVDGEMISLDKPARFSGPGNELTVTKIGENHPMHQYTDFITNTMGTQGIRWLFDPLGQLFYEQDDNDQGSLDWALAFLRPIFSTTSWSGLFFFGGFWNDIVQTTWFTGGKDYLSRMEQGASEASGDLYSPVGRLRGDLAYVGDLGRYYYYHDISNSWNASIPVDRLDDYVIELEDLPFNFFRIEELAYRIGDEVEINWSKGGSDHSQYFEIEAMEKKFHPTNPTQPEMVTLEITLQTIPGADSLGGIPANGSDFSIASAHSGIYDDAEIFPRHRGDSAGPHQDDFLRAMPFRSLPGSEPDPLPKPLPRIYPNLAASAPSPSSQAIPHQLFLKNQHKPLEPGIGDPASYQPSPLGVIPSPPQLQRSRGMYVSFCQPSQLPHRLTTGHVATHQTSLRKGMLAQESCPIDPQELYFDKQVKDVKVFHGETELGATLDLIFCQRANLRVEPAEARVYQCTVIDPKHDKIARNVASMRLLAQTDLGSTVVEIARIYDGKNPQTHLKLPFAVPVRKLKVNVTNKLELREAPTLDAAIAGAEAKPGDSFYLLIPAKLTKTDLKLVQKLNYTTPPSGGQIDPDTGMVPVPKGELDDAVKSYLGLGSAIKITFQNDDPPEEPVEIKWDIEVEATQGPAPNKLHGVIEAGIKLVPHFRLVGDPVAVALNIVDETIVLKTDPANIDIGDFVITSPDGIANPAEHFKITVANDRKSITFTVKANTLPGDYHVMVSSQENSDHKARRTIRVLE